MIVEVPVKVQSRECPYCHTEYWNSRENCHLFCDSSIRRCYFCGREFLDKTLFIEWKDMTKRQKRYWLHWHGCPHRIMLFIFGILTSLLTISLVVGFFSMLSRGDNNSVGVGLAAGLIIPGPIACFIFAFKDFHFMWNYKKDKAVRESLERTGDETPSSFDFTSKDKPTTESNDDKTSGDYLKLIEKLHSKLFSKINNLKNKKMDETSIHTIQDLIIRYDDGFLKRVRFIANQNSNTSELESILKNLENDFAILKKL